MGPLGGALSGLLGFILLNGVVCRKINTTIYDTNTAHITYAPQDDFCVRWNNHIFWRTCGAWAKPWEADVYRSQGKLATLHRSLDHEQPRMTIEFRGSAVWLYGPPRGQLPAIPVDHKICLHENHRVASDIMCYRVDVAEAYSVTEDYNAPVVIFAKGGLQDQEHRIVVSVGDPVDDVDKHRGIQFSHAVYTIDRPTPWPTDEDSWRFRKVVMHDTHPLLSYWPKEPISSGWWPWSPDPSGWFSKTYTAEDGTRVSWHELQSRGESNQDEWGVDATVTAGAIAIYGIPKAHITQTELFSDVCVRIDSGPCEIIDVKHAYLNAEHHHEAVLLWQNQALDSYQQTHISIRLVKTGDSNLRVFPFKSIHYFERQEYSSPDPPVGWTEGVVLAHDDQGIVYHPGRHCVRHFAWWCAEWFDPWTWKEAGPSGSVLTYRSTVSSYRKAEDPSITLDFQGSAVYVYGAPKSFMKDGFASQHVCINGECHIVDAEQAYLNAPEAPVESASTDSLQSLGTSNATMLLAIHPELEPVLIWSMTGLDDKIQHSLRLGLAGLPSNDNAEMSIVKVVYTKVTYEPGQPRPDIPIPQPDRTDEGPLYPPHAIEWAPRLPPPQPAPPNPPQHPLPPPPAPTQPPRQSPQTGESSVLPYILWPVLGTLCFFSLCILLVVSCESTDSSERQPIRPRTPPPPYVPHPPAPPRPAPPPFHPRPPPRPNPPPTQPKHAPRPVLPIHPYPGPNSAGSSSSHTDPSCSKSKKPIPKSDLEFADSQRTLVSPNPPVKPEVVESFSKDQNNAGPCPGLNAAPPRPEYVDSVPKQLPISSQKMTHLSTNAPAQAQSASTHPISSALDGASPTPDSRSNRSTSQAPFSSSAFIPAPSHTGSAIPTVESFWRAPVGTSSVTRQPPHTIRPTPQLPSQSGHSSATTSIIPSIRATNTSNRANRHSERVIQPAPTTIPSTPTNPQVAPNPSLRPTIHQTGRQGTTATSRPGLRSPGPQEHAYTPTPALAQWAEGQGYRIDRLVNGAARNEYTRPRTGARRNQGQTRDVMPPFNTATHDTSDQGNADWRAWRRTVEETGRIPPADARINRGVVPENGRGQGRGDPEGSHGVTPSRNNVGANPSGSRTRTENTHSRRGGGSAAPTAAGTGARRPRTNNRLARNNTGQR